MTAVLQVRIRRHWQTVAPLISKADLDGALDVVRDGRSDYYPARLMNYRVLEHRPGIRITYMRDTEGE